MRTPRSRPAGGSVRDMSAGFALGEPEVMRAQVDFLVAAMLHRVVAAHVGLVGRRDLFPPEPDIETLLADVASDLAVGGGALVQIELVAGSFDERHQLFVLLPPAREGAARVVQAGRGQ